MPDLETLLCSVAYAAGLGALFGGFVGIEAMDRDGFAPVRYAAATGLVFGMVTFVFVVWGALLASLVEHLPRCGGC